MARRPSLEDLYEGRVSIPQTRRRKNRLADALQGAASGVMQHDFSDSGSPAPPVLPTRKMPSLLESAGNIAGNFGVEGLLPSVIEELLRRRSG